MELFFGRDLFFCAATRLLHLFIRISVARKTHPVLQLNAQGNFNTKGGVNLRGPSNDPKEFHVVVRLNGESQKNLTDYCNQNGVTRSNAIRTAIPSLSKSAKNREE